MIADLHWGSMMSGVTVNNIISFLRDQSGATSIEYAMIASGIAVAIIAAVTSLGSAVKGNYTSVSAALN